MKIGRSFKFRDQRYQCIGQFETEYRPGRCIPIIELASRCPTCGNPFTITASRTQIRKRELVRRCAPCRQLRLGPVKAPTNPARTSTHKRADRRAIASKLRRSRRSRSPAQRPPGGVPRIAALPRAPTRPEPPQANVQPAQAEIRVDQEQRETFEELLDRYAVTPDAERPDTNKREPLESDVDDYASIMGF